jgi:glycosyltransferase involved in cell wall biosynthesis
VTDAFASTRDANRDALALSIVIPMLNEEQHIDALFSSLRAAIDPLELDYEILCVDDGSTDATFAKLGAAHESDRRVRAVRLSRNFGKEHAISAGLDAARGACVALMDSDLQHPPACLPSMLVRITDGHDVVYAVRRDRAREPWLRRLASMTYFTFLRRVADVQMVEGAGDFVMMRRVVVDALCACRESNRYMKGLFAWAGFRAAYVEYDQPQRAGGGSRFTAWTLLRLAAEGLTSFSMVPLRLTTFLGLAVAAVALVSSGYYLIRSWLYGDPIQGFPSLFVGMLFLGAVQLICLGIMGEYLGRTYIESKRRPLYLIRESIDSPAPGRHS